MAAFLGTLGKMLLPLVAETVGQIGSKLVTTVGQVAN